MMRVFPMGLINGTDSTATLDTTGLSYSFFEPNQGCKSAPIYPTLKTTYENQIISTRRKALPYLTINYKYKDIWDREKQEIDHFINKVGGELNSFYVADISSMETPSDVVDNGSTWTISIGRTRIYSSVANQRSNYGMLWDGSKFKIGSISSVSAGVSITITETYGDLTAADAKTSGVLYPLYRCYFNSVPDFTPTVFIDGNVATSTDAGYMWSGEANFISKYKI